MRSRYSLGFGAMLLFALATLAQTDRGTITGRVTDASGAVMPEVQVTVTNLDTRVVYHGTSNELGLYSIPSLPVGRYSVDLRRIGFKTYFQEGVTISLGQVVKLDATLGIGEATQSVTVEADASLLNAEQATVGTNLKSAELEILPLSVQGGRDVSAFAFNTVPTVLGNDWSTSIGGSLTVSKAIVVDGTDANAGIQGTQTPPGMEAVQQFEVQTSGTGVDAAATGGGAFMYALKSGTNQLHGSAYGFLANEDFDANTWDNNYFGKPRPRDRYNDYGFSAGGPVYLPKIYNGRNKTFFFGSYERYSQTDLRFTSNSVTVPTQAFLNGDFSALLGSTLCTNPANGNAGNCGGAYTTPITVQNNAGQTVPLQAGMIFDPATGNQFTGNIIPSSRISAESQKVVNFYKLYVPTNNSLANNYPTPTNSSPLIHSRRLDFKVDENFSSKNHLSWSLNYFTNPFLQANDQPTLWLAGSADPGPLSRTDNSTTTSTGIRVVDAHTFSGTLLNTFSFAWNYWKKSDAGGSTVQGALGFPTYGPAANTLPRIFFGCVNTFEQVCENTIGNRFGYIYDFAQWHFRNDISWMKGRHGLKFGGELILYRPTDSGSRGTMDYHFSNRTGLPLALSNNAQINQQVGFGFADFLLGDVASADQAVGIASLAGRNGLNFFINDSIRVTPKLTASLGLRWDYNSRWHEYNGQWTNFNLNGQNSTWAPLQGAYEYATSSSDSWERNNDYRQFAPVVGAAYQINNRLVARASWGYHYIPLGINQWGALPYNISVGGAQKGFIPSSFVNAPPNAVAFNWDQKIYAGTVYPGVRDPSANTVYGYATVSVDPNTLHLGHTQNWNAGVQFEITKNMIFDINYVGNVGRGLHDPSIDPVNYPTWSAYQPLLLAGNAGNFIASQADATAAGVPWYPFLTTMQGAYGGYPAYGGISPFPQIAATYGPILFTGTPLGSSAFQGLVMELKKRSSNGLAADLNYTLQKTTGNVSNVPGNINGGNMNEGWVNSSPWQNPYAYQSYADTLEAGYPEHQVKGYVVYELPFGNGKRWLSQGQGLNYLVGGWQLGGLISYRSGLPIQAVYPSFSYPGWSAVYANRVGSVANTFKSLDLKNPSDPSNLMFNPKAFTDPQFGTFGNQSLFSYGFTSWAYYNEDFSILKNFRFGADGRVKLVLRGEFFDVFNRHHWSDPISYSDNATNFGAVQGVTGNRRGQVGARLEW